MVQKIKCQDLIPQSYSYDENVQIFDATNKTAPLFFLNKHMTALL